MNSLQATALFGRQDFSGVSDKYGYYQLGTTLQLALQGLNVYDPTGFLLSESYRDTIVQRLNRYRYYWNFYNGIHFINQYEEGEKKLVVNYCSTVVNKAVDWLIADGFKITASPGNEQVAEFLNQVLQASNISHVMSNAAQFGAITGDSFLYVTAETKDIQGQPMPKDRWRIRVDSINPAYCAPFFNPSKPDEVAAALIQFPIALGANQERQLITIFITPDIFQSWIGTTKQPDLPNPFGMVNLVHIPNNKIANSVFGKSDLEDVVPLNEELNVVANSIRRIIKYHAEPTTIVYGARVSELEKGAKKVWSNLPVDAKVENLQLQGDLAATYNWYNALIEQISVVSETPKQLLDPSTRERISNTSGMAMQLLFLPIESKTERKKVDVTKGLIQVCKLLIIGHKNILGEDIRQLSDMPAEIFNLGVEYTSRLPKDEQMALDIALKKIDAGVWSQAEAIRQVSGTANMQRLVLELAADIRANLSETYELAKANNGMQPNFAAAFLGSPFLTEDLTMVAKQSAHDVGVAALETPQEDAQEA